MERLKGVVLRRLGIDIPPPDPGLADRQAFLKKEEARTINLTPYDNKFGITDTDIPKGYFSSYYGPEASPEERARRKQQLEDFLAEDPRT